MDTLMQAYHHNQWDNIPIDELFDYYTIALNKLYKESILAISTMGYPKDPDFGDEIKPVDIYENLA